MQSDILDSIIHIFSRNYLEYINFLDDNNAAQHGPVPGGPNMI